MDIRTYSQGTTLKCVMPWGGYIGGRAMCSDGKVRALARIAETADTFFSVPASVTVCANGQRWTVSGYISTESEEGWTVETPDTDPTIVKFTAYSYGRNADRLPAGSWKR